MEKVVAKGVGASPGRQKGRLAFSSPDAVALKAAGESVVFMCDEAGAEDRAGIESAVAIVSVRGGLTGDAAIMARALGKPCVIGVPRTRVYYTEKRVVFRGETGEDATDLELTAKSELTVDGKTGELLIAE